MSTAVLRVQDPADFILSFYDARRKAAEAGADELRVEIPAGVYDNGTRTLSLASTRLRKLTIVGIGGPVVYRRGNIAFEAPIVTIRDLVFEGGGDASAAVSVTADERIDVDGLAVIGKRHSRSVGPPRGSITLRAKGDAATASIRRLWLVNNTSSAGAGITIVGSQGHRFAKVEITDAVFANNKMPVGISAAFVSRLQMERILVLEPTVAYGWLELVTQDVQVSINDSVLAAAHGLLSYRQYPDSKPADFTKPIFRKVIVRGGRKGELVEAPDHDVTYGPPFTRTDWAAVADAARRLEVPRQSSLVP